MLRQPLVPIVLASAVLLVVMRPRRQRSRTAWPDAGKIYGFEYDTVRPPGGSAAVPVVLLHGLGGSSEQLLELLGPRLEHPVTFIMPQGKLEGPRWWEGRAADADQVALAERMKATAVDFRRFLGSVVRVFGKPILAGHSQGGMLASLMAYQAPGVVRQAIGASAWVPPGARSSKRAPLTLVHGSSDETVPFERTEDWAASDPSISFTKVKAGHNLNEAMVKAWATAINEAVAPSFG